MTDQSQPYTTVNLTPPSFTSSYYPHPPHWSGKLAAALIKAQAEVRAAAKGGDNKFDKYTYSKLEDFYEVAKPVLANNGLALVLETTLTEGLPDRTTKNAGVEHAVRVQVRGLLIHVSGESLAVSACGEGQDRADKSVYKAITGARKYLIAGLLAIPTSDDPEADEQVGLSAKGVARPKLDSSGNAKTKIPKWHDDQVKEAGGYIGSIRDLLTKAGTDIISADMQITHWRTAHKYDEPADVIDALALWKHTLEEGSAP